MLCFICLYVFLSICLYIVSDDEIKDDQSMYTVIGNIGWANLGGGI